MREVKFKIYDKQEKKFLIKNQKIKNGDIKSILNEIIDLEECSIQINNPEENRYEFLQSTGIKDMNGKEIYEGDIVKFDDTGEDEYYECYDFKNVAEITFNNGRYELKNFLEKNTTVSNGMIRDWDNEMWFEFMDKELTIIGNIYENPELLGDN